MIYILHLDIGQSDGDSMNKGFHVFGAKMRLERVIYMINNTLNDFILKKVIDLMENH